MNTNFEHNLPSFESVVTESTVNEQIQSAYIDNELSATKRAEFEALLKEQPILQNQLDQQLTTDRWGRDWYQTISLTDEAHTQAIHPTPSNNSWRILSMATLAAASIAMVFGVSYFIPTSHEILADEALRKTAKALYEGKGFLIKYTIEIETSNDRFNPNGKKRMGAGQIRVGSFREQSLRFYCEENWPATKEDPRLLRLWGQSQDRQWFQEFEGESSNSYETYHEIDPTLSSDFESYKNEKKIGTPIDPGSHTAIEGLVYLLKHFEDNKSLKWFGCQWKALGGKGTGLHPWKYETNPFPDSKNVDKKKGPRFTWQLELSTTKAGIIYLFNLTEIIRNPESKTPLSKVRIQFHLTIKQKPWANKMLSGDSSFNQATIKGKK